MNANAPEPELEIPECPKHLSDDAKAEWDEIAPELYKLGLLSKIDKSALASYCDSYGRWVQACRRINRDGLIVTEIGSTSQETKKPNPAIKIAQTEKVLMRQLLTEFGMTPAARSRVDAKPPPDPNPFAGLDPMEELRLRKKMRAEGKLKDDWDDFQRTGELDDEISKQKREKANAGKNNSNQQSGSTMP
jgi:P27 family predicted phage terminase small subunit